MSEDNFPKPLGQWTEEEIDVTVISPRLSSDGKRVEALESNVVKQKQKTIYLKEEVAFKSCEDGGHYWELKNPNRYAFECKKCHLGKFAPPWIYLWELGTLTKI